MRVAIVENTKITHHGQMGVALHEAGALIDLYRPYLDGETFTAGDLLVADVLRQVPEAILAETPTLVAYRDRCTARPAFQKALAAQLADLNGPPPPGWG